MLRQLSDLPGMLGAPQTVIIDKNKKYADRSAKLDGGTPHLTIAFRAKIKVR